MNREVKVETTTFLEFCLWVNAIEKAKQYRDTTIVGAKLAKSMTQVGEGCVFPCIVFFCLFCSYVLKSFYTDEEQRYWLRTHHAGQKQVGLITHAASANHLLALSLSPNTRFFIPFFLSSLPYQVGSITLVFVFNSFLLSFLTVPGTHSYSFLSSFFPSFPSMYPSRPHSAAVPHQSRSLLSSTYL
jgi:hypothetical protein